MGNNQYNIDFYTKEKASQRSRYYSSGNIFYKSGLDTNKIFFDYIVNHLENNLNNHLQLLDLGTGTGYVPEILTRISKHAFKIIGVDLSDNMLNSAKQKIQDPRVSFKKCDNFHLPFPDKSFDIITNKLTTQFAICEVMRVLKSGGIFVFKEFGKYKGFKEIYDIFSARFSKTKINPEEYLQELYGLGFRECSLSTFLIRRKYILDEIEQIFNMANLIIDFNKNDLATIKKELAGKANRLDITSDPFIIYAKK